MKIAAGFRWGMPGLIAAAVLALDFAFVPLHGGDDDNHFASAYVIAHGQFGVNPPPGPEMSSGGYVDRAIPALIERNWMAVRDYSRRLPVHDSRTPWTGQQVFMPLTDAGYLPALLLPQAAAVWVGEHAGLSVEQTVILARTVNALAALALLGLALAYLPTGVAAFVLVLLVLPKSLQLLPSNAVEPYLYGLTALIAAFYWRALTTDWRPSPWLYALVALAVLVLGGARPPFVALGLAPLYVAFRKRSAAGLVLCGLGIAGALLWWAYALPRLVDVNCPRGAAMDGRWLAFALHWPEMIWATLNDRGAYYVFSFLGENGYGDGVRGIMHPLPRWMYATATMLVLAALLSAGEKERDMSWLDRALPLGIGLLALGGVALSFSVACSVKSNVIVGIQGRYFCAPLIMAALTACAVLPPSPAVARLVRMATPAALVAFAVAAFVIAKRHFS